VQILDCKIGTCRPRRLKEKQNFKFKKKKILKDKNKIKKFQFWTPKLGLASQGVWNLKYQSMGFLI
jgi:hypothetical protein